MTTNITYSAGSSSNNNTYPYNLTLTSGCQSQYMNNSDYSLLSKPSSNLFALNSTGLTLGSTGYVGLGGFYGNSTNVQNYLDNYRTYATGMIDIQGDVQDAYSNRQTTSTFVQRGNEFTQNVSNLNYQSMFQHMKEAILDNNTTSACEIYDNIYEAMEKEVGQEMNQNSDRVSMTDIRGTIENYYLQYNGSSMKSDIKEYCNGAFRAGANNQLSANETISYMTGEGYKTGWWQKTCKTVGGWFSFLGKGQNYNHASSY